LQRAGASLVKTRASGLAFWSGLFELSLGHRSRGGGGCVISGAVPKKQKKQQDKTPKCYL
jgi:hypothetical protein